MCRTRSDLRWGPWCSTATMLYRPNKGVVHWHLSVMPSICWAKLKMESNVLPLAWSRRKLRVRGCFQMSDEKIMLMVTWHELEQTRIESEIETVRSCIYSQNNSLLSETDFVKRCVEMAKLKEMARWTHKEKNLHRTGKTPQHHRDQNEEEHINTRAKSLRALEGKILSTHRQAMKPKK